MRRGIFRFVFLLIVGSLIVPAGGSTLAAPGARSGATVDSEISASQYRPDSEECEMLGRINSYRKSKGLSAVKLSRTLGAAADHHSQEMAKYNYFSHTMRNGVSVRQNLTNHGYPTGAYYGEIIAAGNSGASNTLRQWRNSSGHNAILLTADYKAVGIGRASSSSSRYGVYWTAIFGSATDHTMSC